MARIGNLEISISWGRSRNAKSSTPETKLITWEEAIEAALDRNFRGVGPLPIDPKRSLDQQWSYIKAVLTSSPDVISLLGGNSTFSDWQEEDILKARTRLIYDKVAARYR